MPVIISVIIPAYNVEEYLPSCLDSIIAQDFQDYEIIIIDDGSSDRTSEISNDYAEKNNKISVIHQKNAGLSSARNAGIKSAKGEFFTFVDGDDLVAPNFLSRLYQAIKSENSDIAICNFSEFSETVSSETEASEIKVVSRNESVIKLLIGQENRDVIVCNKLYKKKIFKDIKFPVGEIHEDNLTTYKLLANATSVANIDDALYFYRRRAGSITDTHGLLLGLKVKERAAKEAIEYFKNDPELKQAAEVSLLLSKFGYLDHIASGEIHDEKLWKKVTKEIKSIEKSYKNNPHLTRKLKLYLALLKAPHMYRFFRRIIH